MTKYGAVPTIVDGIRFASKAEARRYQELRLLERASEISGLTLQPRFDLIVNGQKICRYVADFQYRDSRTKALTIEDVKGLKTAVYKIKKALMKAVHDIEIVEVRA